MMKVVKTGDGFQVRTGLNQEMMNLLLFNFPPKDKNLTFSIGVNSIGQTMDIDLSFEVIEALYAAMKAIQDTGRSTQQPPPCF